MRARRRGITLVEVLLAAVVCGAGLSVILSGIAATAKADIHAEALVRATRLLELELGRLEGGVVPLAAATGDFSLDGAPDVSWTIDVQPTDTTNLNAVTLTATWKENQNDDDRTFSIVRLIFQDPDAPTNTTAGTGGGQ